LEVLDCRLQFRLDETIKIVQRVGHHRRFQLRIGRRTAFGLLIESDLGSDLSIALEMNELLNKIYQSLP
jgi:hypothetical protein